MKDWQLTLLGAVIGIIASGLGATASYFYTKSLEDDALRGQSIVGEHTLNSMGYLYFSALIHVFDFDHFTKSGKFIFTNDSVGKKVNKGAYFSVLRQLQENARQIVENQGYAKFHKGNQPDIAELAALSSYLGVEYNMKSDSPLFGSIGTMCNIFNNSYMSEWTHSYQFSLSEVLHSFDPFNSFDSDGLVTPVDDIPQKINLICERVRNAEHEAMNRAKFCE